MGAKQPRRHRTAKAGRLVALCCCAAALAGCSQSPDEGTDGAARRGPRLVAPRLVAATLHAPSVELPQVAWPPIEGPAVLGPELVRPPLADPDLRDLYQTDSHSQKTLRVDVLWVVDNSGSMANERERLAASFERFMTVLARRRIDYHVGVISTHVDEESGGELRAAEGLRMITPDTANAIPIFATMVEFEPGRERREQGFEAMRRALSAPLTDGANRGFLRPDGALAVVLVSDEDDGSFGEPEHFARFLQHTRRPGDERLATLSAIVGLPPDGCVPPGEEHIFGADADPAERTLRAVEVTGGLAGSICETDFDPLLEALGQRVSVLTRIFPLSGLPQEDTITVRVDDAVVPAQGPDGVAWEYRSDIRSVVFEEHTVPGSGSQVYVSYVVDAGVRP